MYNWSVDINYLKKFPQKYKIWRLEQLINFGLGREKLDPEELRKNLKKLKIDKTKRKYLKFLLNQQSA